jgi:GT2 family glycosyltransferase
VFVAENSETLLNNVKKYADLRTVKGTFVMNNGSHGLAQGRNLGAKLSNGEIIALIDDDVALPQQWARAIIDGFNDEGIIGVTGPALPLWENEELTWLPKEFYWLISCTAWNDFENESDMRSAWGMNMAFRREAFGVSGGFLENTGYHKPMPEDEEFSLRVKAITGKRIGFCKDAYLYHRANASRFTWKFIADRSFHIGITRYTMRRLNYSVKLNRESSLLTKMAKNIPIQAIRSPKNSLKIARVTLLVLLFISLGYTKPIVRRDADVDALVNEFKKNEEKTGCIQK